MLLIILNGIFAMAEIAIVSARKSKLQQLAHEGNQGAKIALELSNNPNRFLSTVQIGITLIGIFAGAFGGATIAATLSDKLRFIPFIGGYSDALALGIVVVSITYLSLIIGELVPKRLALNSPEKIALYISRPMNSLSIIAAPFVSLLSVSTDWMLRLLQVGSPKKASVSEEEVKMLIREGAQSGVFQIAEQAIVERTLLLSDKKVSSLMTSRKEIVWLNIDSSFKSLRNTMVNNSHSHFPVCRDNLDKVIGVVRTKTVLTSFMAEEKIDLKKSLHKPLFVPESMDSLKVLELFKKSGIHMALVIDEYGNVQGLVALADILRAIVGDIPTINELEEKEIVKREDNSYLVDGLVSVDEFKEYFNIKKLPSEKSGIYHTIGGFVMHQLGHIPVSGDRFEYGAFRFEVMDMDGNRVDKVLVTPLKKFVV